MASLDTKNPKWGKIHGQVKYHLEVQRPHQINTDMEELNHRIYHALSPSQFTIDLTHKKNIFIRVIVGYIYIFPFPHKTIALGTELHHSLF